MIYFGVTKIYLIRHAQSMANLLDINGGSINYTLSPAGMLQAEGLCSVFRDVNVAAVYSSPLVRAQQTIAPYCMRTNRLINVEEDLRELHCGEFENFYWSELKAKYPDIITIIEQTENHSHSIGAEQAEHCAKRVTDCLTRLAKKHNGETIICVSHCQAMRDFLCVLWGIPFDKIREKFLEHPMNAGIVVLEYNGKFKVTKKDW